MRLLVLSDLHVENHALTLAERNCAKAQFDAVVLAGDIHTPGWRGVAWASDQPQFAGKPVLYVPGNHEFYGTDPKKGLQDMRVQADGSAVKVLSQGEWMTGDVHVLGCTLWTDYALPVRIGDEWVRDPEDFMAEARFGLSDHERINAEPGAEGREDGPVATVRRKSLRPARSLRPGAWTPEHALQAHIQDLAWLRARLEGLRTLRRTIVVVTHHAPSARSVPKRYVGHFLSPAFASDLPLDVFEGVSLWVHGHMHDSQDYQVPWPSGHGACRVVCNPRGYLRKDGSHENLLFKPGWIVSV